MTIPRTDLSQPCSTPLEWFDDSWFEWWCSLVYEGWRLENVADLWAAAIRDGDCPQPPYVFVCGWCGRWIAAELCDGDCNT